MNLSTVLPCDSNQAFVEVCTVDNPPWTVQAPLKGGNLRVSNECSILPSHIQFFELNQILAYHIRNFPAL
jgi:hypothetical protein